MLEQVKDRSNTPVPSTRGTRATDWLKYREAQFFGFSGKGGHPWTCSCFELNAWGENHLWTSNRKVVSVSGLAEPRTSATPRIWESPRPVAGGCQLGLINQRDFLIQQTQLVATAMWSHWELVCHYPYKFPDIPLGWQRFYPCAQLLY